MKPPESPDAFRLWPAEGDPAFIAWWARTGLARPAEAQPFAFGRSGRCEGVLWVGGASPDGTVRRVVGIYVDPAARGRGLARQGAEALFNRFGGAWEVALPPSDAGLQAFWRSVVHRYTAGYYHERADAEGSTLVFAAPTYFGR